MIRGTTPTLQFTLPFSTNNIDELWITFAFEGKELFTKYKRECELEGQSVKLKLSQSDTLLFSENTMVEIQIRLRLLNGETMASEILTEPAYRVLKDGEI